ncbi:hypothetical protein [Marispirochaeta sp.]|uniref:hypothetical protein n=1 Tax=Marispirochaeta sp. TaxID=2038653 RepID=UPI0029C6171F|nr:hypothetical protein [Marispirochaeta sp.]
MKKEKWLRTGYWLAAIADLIIAARVFIPALLRYRTYEYPLGIVAAVGVSWGILLLIASKKPVERRWILLPTIFVIFLITIVYTHSLVTRQMPLSQGLFSSVSGLLILLVNVIAFIKSGQNCQAGGPKDGREF